MLRPPTGGGTLELVKDVLLPGVLALFMYGLKVHSLISRFFDSSLYSCARCSFFYSQAWFRLYMPLFMIFVVLRTHRGPYASLIAVVATASTAEFGFADEHRFCYVLVVMVVRPAEGSSVGTGVGVVFEGGSDVVLCYL